MSFHHRKLLNDSLEHSVERFCLSFCDPAQNLDGSCPVTCILQCYPTCNHPLLLGLPPPPPDHTLLSDGKHSTQPSGLYVSLSVSLGVLATTFLIFSIYMIYKFYKRRYTSSRSRQLIPQPQQQPREDEEAHLDFLDEDQGPVVDHPIWYIRTVGLQPSVINAITICKYKRGDGLVEGTECSVCLNEFQEDETLRLLPKCNHAFHIPCIDTWLRSHTNCPNCRAGIVMSTANLQSSLQSHHNSGRVEEIQMGVSENNRDSERERERESESLEVGVEVEEEDESRVGTGNASRRNENFMEDVGNSGAREEEGIQPLRRSVSMDSLSAFKVSAAIANAFPPQCDRNSDNKNMQMNGSSMGLAPKGAGNEQCLSRSEGCSSVERSSQKETSAVKRSLSCSARVFLSRYSRSRNSVPPP
ncbi:uncharacterized protein [Coffea arabica]|uniref:RING-type E3 ubiquitin transferase n=1 Tax=Coffea arabica TaxID=13443 RepID=A0A6P6WC48_COFAR|nr:E3 ubiquitin-protein ligase RING1-like [Coffea arabica]